MNLETVLAAALLLWGCSAFAFVRPDNLEEAKKLVCKDADPLDFVRKEIGAGKKSVVVPKGRYWIVPPEGVATYLELNGVEGVTIDFSGSELVGIAKKRMFRLGSCTNVTLRNVAVDYADLPFTQATIEKVDADGSWDVRVIPGYPCPEAGELRDTEAFWPVQAYDGKTLELKNPMRHLKKIAIERTGTDTYRITGGRRKTGDVGDIAVWSLPGKGTTRGSVSAISAGGCRNCTFENVTVYAVPRGCGFVESSSEGNRFLRCSLVRRPPETDLFPRTMKRLRSGNMDALNSRSSYSGPTLDGCTFQYQCDDCVNISGYYAAVVGRSGRTLRIVQFGNLNRIEPGDSCQIMTFSGECPPDVKVLSVTPAGKITADEWSAVKGFKPEGGMVSENSKVFEAVLDEERDLSPGAMIVSNRRMGNGFAIRNCTMGRNRARGMLIKASYGLIESNTIERSEYFGLQMSPEYQFMEGGCSRSVTVRDNVFAGNGTCGVVMYGNCAARRPLPANAHSDIAITGNRISGSPEGISVTGCTGLDLRGNFIVLPDAPRAKGLVLRNVSEVRRS
ncbi:MAG: right-handed parallel beta-helix repeat-containing protein [Kiritimatiellae bacterium]|nr:right-handed parallel beta-helix repeat-containing protein [Kiritimatiellia bacterium]